MPDKIEKTGNSVIQHGAENDRVYLMKVDDADVPDIIDRCAELAENNSYSKIFAKVRLRFKSIFEDAGYRLEAMVPDFYDGNEGAVFISKFLTEKRSLESEKETVESNLKIAESKAETPAKSEDGNWRIIEAEAKDAEQICEVFKEVFVTYPFPVHDVEYIKSTMDSHIRYFCAVDQDTGEVGAVSSAEMDVEAKNVEMTDFATLPKYRGKALATKLLERMESEMSAIGIKKAYTIARAYSAEINILFARAGYEYAGTLVNNTNICGRFESMNVWHKFLV